MSGKTKTFFKWLPSLLVAVFMLSGVIMKWVSAPQLTEQYSKIGMRDYMNSLGVAELLFAGLFLWPRTMRLGFFLLTAYYGGAMAIELSIGMFFIFPATILTVIWIGAYLRDPSLFWPAQRQKELSPSSR